MTAQLTDPAPETPKQKTPAGFHRIVAASMAGTVAEWYEFFSTAWRPRSSSATCSSRRPAIRSTV